VVAQYAVLGSYDFITVIEAPDNESVAHLSLALGSRGTVNIVTLPAKPAGAEVRNSSGHAIQRGCQG